MEAICALKDIYKALYQFEKDFQASHGMTINEAMLMCCLHEGDAKSAGALCEFIGLSASRVSKIINSVEKMGYIERSISAEDKRQMLFSLTASGWRKVTEMKKIELHIDELYAQLRDSIGKG
jgi:DNA-binding MarR family transcriptional regulator